MPLKWRRTIQAAGGLDLLGAGRVYKNLWLPAKEFETASGLSQAASEFEGGSMMTASLNIDVSGSIFANTHQASLGFPVIQPNANVTGSPTYAHAIFQVPTDADSSGSVTARVVWTTHDQHATNGSTFALGAALTYISASAAARTAACVGAACGTYNYTASGVFHETALPDLPSFGANDVAGILTLLHDQSDSEDTGGSGIAFLGVKLRYVADSLGDRLGASLAAI